MSKIRDKLISLRVDEDICDAATLKVDRKG